jgi:tRNA (guanine9-N1)-methyltransferase
VDLLCTSLGGRLAERFHTVGGDRHTRWKGIEFWTAGYEALYEPPPPEASTSVSAVPKDSVVYLTADSPNVIDEIEEGTTYIIGGIVDHNRYKVYFFSVSKR